MSQRRRPPHAPIHWAPEALEHDRALAIETFRRERIEEPLQAYLNAFSAAEAILARLFAQSADLTRLDAIAPLLIADPGLLEGLRYLVGPPISADDLKTLIDAPSLAPAALRRQPALCQQLITTIASGLDRRRFPWLFQARLADPAERTAALTATAALVATQRVATRRRSEGKLAQEEQVRQALLTHGLVEVRIAERHIPNLAKAPGPGQFCREALFGTRRADLVVGLGDGRTMPIECKVSNSATNSVKRLNNDAAVKAEVWLKDFGTLQVVPAAVLSGVYKLHNLEEAQRRGLSLFWAHRLADLTAWIAATAHAA